MFKYLICLDFEATCWPGRYASKENAEIIEIGAVLLNLSTREIEDKFHCYVRPTICPKLTAFCIKLTGITQSKVDREDAFEVVYRKFNDWIQKIQRDKKIKFASPTETQANVNGIEAAFCTWSSFDLEFYFKKECQRLSIDTPPYFKAWVDARIYFNKKYPLGRCKFSEALKRANIDAVGSAHSGIDDATNLAKLVSHLVLRGIQFCRVDDYY